MNQDDDGTGRPMVIRGGLVLDATGFLGATDIVVRDGTIAAIGPLGIPLPDGAVIIDASRRLLHPGLVNAHTHGHGNLSRSMGDRWTLELLLAAAPHMSPYAERRGEAHFGNHRCGRDAAEGLHRLLRPVRRISPADRGRHRGGCRSLYASRHARRDRTHDGRHDVVRGDPWPDGRAAAAFAERGGAARPAAMAGDDRADAIHPAPWHGDRTMVRPAVAPTIPLHCRDEFMVACRDLAAEFDVGIHTHLAESKLQAVVGARRTAGR